MMTDPILHTERLSLKSVTPAVIHQLYNTKEKEEIMNFFGFDEAGYLKFKNMHEMGMETYSISLYSFIIIHKESNLPIGDCGFHTWNKVHSRAELFYLLRNDSNKRKGYLTEALPVILDFGFNNLKLNRIEALVANDNIPSVKLLSRFGFTKEGTMRGDYFINGKHEDSDCYSLLRSEWEGQSNANSH